MISAACSTQSSVRGGDAAARIPTDGGKTPTNNKSGSVKPDLDEESAESSLPQEISGAFLTCSYVTAKESGFPESTERVPVGCVVERGESQFEDSLYDLDMKLYSPSKNVEEIDIRPSISNTKWQRFAHLPRAGKTKHSFGMVLTDKRSGESYGPLLFPVTKLTSSSDEVTLNLVGSYVPNAVHSIETQDNPLNQKNIDTPILPAAICSDGMIRESVDMNQYKDIVAVGGAIIGKVIQGIANKDIVPSEKIEVNSKPTRAVRCFGIAKEAGPNSYSETIRTQPVLEGGGCFILQSEQGVVVYDQKTINKYNIKREFLETYVLKNQCSPSQQRK
jgi:hypothetical protein